jgi:hypothetical protein
MTSFSHNNLLEAASSGDHRLEEYISLINKKTAIDAYQSYYTLVNIQDVFEWVLGANENSLQRIFEEQLKEGLHEIVIPSLISKRKIVSALRDSFWIGLRNLAISIEKLAKALYRRKIDSLKEEQLLQLSEMENIRYARDLASYAVAELQIFVSFTTLQKQLVELYTNLCQENNYQIQLENIQQSFTIQEVAIFPAYLINQRLFDLLQLHWNHQQKQRLQSTKTSAINETIYPLESIEALLLFLWNAMKNWKQDILSHQKYDTLTMKTLDIQLQNEHWKAMRIFIYILLDSYAVNLHDFLKENQLLLLFQLSFLQTISNAFTISLQQVEILWAMVLIDNNKYVHEAVKYLEQSNVLSSLVFSASASASASASVSGVTASVIGSSSASTSAVTTITTKSFITSELFEIVKRLLSSGHPKDARRLLLACELIVNDTSFLRSKEVANAIVVAIPDPTQWKVIIIIITIYRVPIYYMI